VTSKLVNYYRRFRGTCCLHLQFSTLRIEAANSFKTLATRPHDVTSQKSVIIIVTVVRTSDLAKCAYILFYVRHLSLYFLEHDEVTFVHFAKYGVYSTNRNVDKIRPIGLM
jgi:hypothetical protein